MPDDNLKERGGGTSKSEKEIKTGRWRWVRELLWRVEKLLIRLLTIMNRLREIRPVKCAQTRLVNKLLSIS